MPANSKLKNKSAKLVAALLDWFAANARDLPWRRTRDPYGIWVSEIMLQQTQVKTVIPYWERWMRELPTIQAAAKASSAKLHKLWEGLGYYTRVRNLQTAAQQIIARHDGKFPEGFEDILALQGIGRYTAGAISSIAFNQPRPILDGNVIRVLTRVFGITANPREKETNAHLWVLAETLVGRAKDAKGAKEKTASRSSRPSRETNSCSFLNQSLMELGALICTPRAPQCEVCPVRMLCVARAKNLQYELPNLGERVKTTERRFVAFVVERDGKYLVRQRPVGVVNAHLWEFPNVEVESGEGRANNKKPLTPALSPSDGARETERAAFENCFRVSGSKQLCTIKHSITRYRITLEAWRAEMSPANAPDRRSALQGEWRTLAQLHKLAFTGAHKKILRVVNAQ